MAWGATQGCGFSRANCAATVYPVRLSFLIREGTHWAGVINLTGNPPVDFARVQVTGPSYPEEYFMVELRKPHDVPFVRKSPTPPVAHRLRPMACQTSGGRIKDQNLHSQAKLGL